MNDEQRQTEVANEVEAAARQLAHSTRNVPNARDSYELLGSLAACVGNLAQVSGQLARWHDRVSEGVEYVGEDERGDGSGTRTAAAALRQAGDALDAAAAHLDAAHSANGVVRWGTATDPDLIVPRPRPFSLKDYRNGYGRHYDAEASGSGLFGETFPENVLSSDHLQILLHGPEGGPGNLIVIDTENDVVWLYREDVSRIEAMRTIEDGMARAAQLGREFEHTDIPSDFFDA